MSWLMMSLLSLLSSISGVRLSVRLIVKLSFCSVRWIQAEDIGLFLSFSMEIKSWSVKPKDVSVFVGHGWARMSPEKAMPQKSCHFCHLIAFAYVIRIGLHHHAGDNNAHSYCHFAPNCHFESLFRHCLVMSLGLSLDLSFNLSFNLCFGRFCVIRFDSCHSPFDWPYNCL